MVSILITGASRGIGLGLVKALLDHPNPPEKLIATCRNPDSATELQELAEKTSSLYILQLDVTEHETFNEFADKVSEIVGSNGLNVILNNAGVNSQADSLDKVEVIDYVNAYKTNVISPVFLIRTLLPLIRQAASLNIDKPMGIERAAILNMSSLLGSLTVSPGYYFAYSSSKAALNMETRALAKRLKDDGILVVPLHPGWVRTDMGGPMADISLDESVTGLINVIYNLDETKHDRLITWDGRELTW